MKKTMGVVMAALVAVPLMLSVSEARRGMLDEVNATCGTIYSCALCHVDPKGGGELTSAGRAYLVSGTDPCYFCANSCGASPTCTDRDGDGYFAEGGTCGPVDCNDTNNTIYPGACDVLRDGIDQDCSGADRLKGKACP